MLFSHWLILIKFDYNITNVKQTLENETLYFNNIHHILIIFKYILPTNLFITKQVFSSSRLVSVNAARRAQFCNYVQ